jgi:signal peptidase I
LTAIIEAQPRHRHRRARRHGAPGPLRKVGNSAITLALVAVIAMLVGGYVAGWRTYVVQSGSMGAAAPVGSIVAARPISAADLRVGQMVLLTRPNGVRVLHRVIEHAVTGNQVMVRTKGDANRSADPGLFGVPASTLTPALVVPKAGYAVAALASTPGRSLLVVLAGMLLVGAALRRRDGAPVRPGPASADTPAVAAGPAGPDA